MVLEEHSPSALHPLLVLNEEWVERIWVLALIFLFLFELGSVDLVEVRILSSVAPAPADSLDGRANPRHDRRTFIIVVQKPELFVGRLPHLLTLVVILDFLILVIR